MDYLSPWDERDLGCLSVGELQGGENVYLLFLNFRDAINITALLNEFDCKTLLKPKEATQSVSIPIVLKSGLA